jgi:hypothetical protein
VTNSLICGEALTFIEAVQLAGCAASSFSWVSLASPLVIAISAAIALASLRASKEMARKKATLDLIEKVESTSHYRHLQTTFAYFKRTQSFDRLHDPHEEKDRADRSAIQDFLSHYELVSIRIEAKILDPKFYQDWMANPFVRDWNSASDFIQRERWKWNTETSKWEYYDRLFETYQRIARKFSTEAIELNAAYSGPPNKPKGPGDKSLP